MKCTNCGAELQQDAMFCNVCGERIEVTPQQSPLSVSPPQKNNNMLIIIIAAIVVAVAVVAAAIIMASSDNNEPQPTENATTPEPVVVIATPEPTDTIQTPPPITEETILSVMYVVKCNEYITLRTAPSTSAEEIVKIPLGASVGFVSNAENGFYKVSYNGKRGYALASYLSSSPEQSVSYDNTMRVVNCDEWISLRQSPSTNADRITTIPLGAHVDFISTASNGFYKIRYNGYVGYALASYLQ